MLITLEKDFHHEKDMRTYSIPVEKTHSTADEVNYIFVRCKVGTNRDYRMVWFYNFFKGKIFLQSVSRIFMGFLSFNDSRFNLFIRKFLGALMSTALLCVTMKDVHLDWDVISLPVPHFLNYVPVLMWISTKHNRKFPVLWFHYRMHWSVHGREQFENRKIRTRLLFRLSIQTG